MLYFYICSGLSGKYQVLGDISLRDEKTNLLVVPVCLKTKARTEHLGVFLGKKQVALGLRSKRAFRLCSIQGISHLLLIFSHKAICQT